MTKFVAKHCHKIAFQCNLFRKRVSRHAFVVTITLLLTGNPNALSFAVDTKNSTEQAWQLQPIPAAWKTAWGGPEEIYQWFRCLVVIPETWKEQPIEIFVEAVDDAREVYFNGQTVGHVGTFPPDYRSGLGAALRFPVDSKLVLFGEQNIIALRVYHNQNRGGFNVAAPVLFCGSNAIRMKGQWEQLTGDNAEWSKLSVRSHIVPQAVFDKVESATAMERTLKQLDDDKGPLSVAESLQQFNVPDDLKLECVVSEPNVCQPVSLKWDERGRLWVVQYLQYPNPAGLTMVSRDKYLRAVYDQVPPPPPHHFEGKDRITVHEDTSGDGVYDQHKIFVDGLSMVTSLARGRGGVWVLNPPYLLFYSDQDGNDIPDKEPEVHLEGFGLEDSHAIASNLRWGPDGWLYASQGSTVSANVKRFGSQDPVVHTAGQLIWRYHPESRRYEVFAEGGGNTFGVEFDAQGRVFSGHNGGNTRGFHYVQGGYYSKGFGKHGSLSNPYAFGYFSAIAHHSAPRFTHAFVIYEADALPTSYHGKLMGVAPLQSEVVYSTREPDRSSFKTKDVGHILKSKDPWCRPVDIQVGPDGGIYVADMYEQRIDHASHYQGRIHRTTGRVYRLRDADRSSTVRFDLGQASSEELVALLKHKNKWFRQTALRLIGDRRDTSIIPLLQKQLQNHVGQVALESLWALHQSGGLTDQIARQTLRHSDPYVRLWTVRLLCDRPTIPDSLAAELASIASGEPDLQARSQYACSARRLPVQQSLPLVANLLRHSSDATDIHTPLLLWWAIEAQVTSNAEAVLELFADRSLWHETITQQHLLERLMRRFAQAGNRSDLFACAKLLELAPSKEFTKKLLVGFEQAYQGRSLVNLPDELVRAITRTGGGSLALRLRQNNPEAIRDAIAAISNPDEELIKRLQYIHILGNLKNAETVPVLLLLVQQSEENEMRRAALTSLQGFDDPTIGTQIASIQPQLPEALQEVALMLLASRREWAIELLSSIEQNTIDPESVRMSVVRRMLLLRDAQIESSVGKYWGKVQGATTAEMFTEMERLTKIVHNGSGIPHNGKDLFMKNCGKCHTLFTEGGNIGPNLTSYQRDNLRQILVNIVNPSLEIREGFENFVIQTENGLTLNGFITDEDNQVVVLKTAEGQRVIIPKDEIEQQVAVKRSLMPEGTLKNLSNQQVRDLFAFLRSSQPLP